MDALRDAIHRYIPQASKCLSSNNDAPKSEIAKRLDLLPLDTAENAKGPGTTGDKTLRQLTPNQRGDHGATTMNDSDLVQLRGGLVLPLGAIQLALELESRGLRIALDGDAVVISPRQLLTDADRVLIRRWKLHLQAMVNYDADTLDAPRQ